MAEEETKKTQEPVPEDVKPTPEEKTVPYSRFSEVNKGKKDAEARVNELQEKLDNLVKEQEAAKVKEQEEQNQFKPLYEETKLKLEESQQTIDTLKLEMVNSKKVSALEKRFSDKLLTEDLLKLIPLDSLTIEDGSVHGLDDLEERLKEEHPDWFVSEDHPKIKIPNTKTKMTNNPDSKYLEELKGCETLADRNRVMKKYGRL